MSKYWIRFERQQDSESCDGGYGPVIPCSACYVETMRLALDPFRLLLISLAGCLAPGGPATCCSDRARPNLAWEANAADKFGR